MRDHTGTPGSPVEMSITKTSSALDIHWSEGDIGGAPVSGYVIEARPSGELPTHQPQRALSLLSVLYSLFFPLIKREVKCQSHCAEPQYVRPSSDPLRPAVQIKSAVIF